MLYGVNLSGAEFGRGNNYAHDYIYPSAANLQYYANKGVDFVRLPFRWERIQPELNGELDQAELGRIQKFLSNAETAGVKVILDVHNYAGYDNVKIGSGDVTIDAFQDLWGKLAGALKDYTAITGYGLMNEPSGVAAQTWFNAAQAAIDTIREQDPDTAIYVCGVAWSGAHSWLKYNSGMNALSDPSNNLIFEAHQYFDKDSSGDYSMSYDAEKATPTIGVERLQPFLTWLEENGLKGFIGEYAIPDNDPRWQVVMENFLAELSEHNIPSAYWGGGPWWGSYPMSIEPDKNGDSIQMDILENFIAAHKQKELEADDENPEQDQIIPIADKIFGSDESDVIEGTGNADKIWGKAGNDHLLGGAGDDKLYGDEGDDILNGGDGRDTMLDKSGNNTMIGGDGNDRLYAGDGDDFLWGGIGRDMLVGSAGNDSLWGGDDNDTLEAGDGEDHLYGESGNDLLDGGKGNDWIYGNIGDDKLYGHDGNDYLDAGDGNDLARGGSGDDYLSGGSGDDMLYGEDGDDVFEGGDGKDTLNGGAGNDILDGGDGNDRLYAADGDDWLWGGTGKDMLEGGHGNDVLNGGLGNDTLCGGAGIDMFVFGEDEGIDRLLDFNFGEGDRLDIGDQSYTVHNLKGSTQIDLSGGGTIMLSNIKPIDVDESFFIQQDVIL